MSTAHSLPHKLALAFAEILPVFACVQRVCVLTHACVLVYMCVYVCVHVCACCVHILMHVCLYVCLGRPRYQHHR